MLGAKAGYDAWPLHSVLPKGQADHLSQPCGLTSGHTPPLTPYKAPTPPPPPAQRVSKGTCYFFLPPLAAAGAPIKPCLNFLSGLLSISIG